MVVLAVIYLGHFKHLYVVSYTELQFRFRVISRQWTDSNIDDDVDADTRTRQPICSGPPLSSPRDGPITSITECHLTELL